MTDPKQIDTQNNKIDALLQMRQDGMYNYTQSSDELMRLGVKIGNKSTGQVTLPNSFTPHLDKFERSMLEFEWEVTYKDGTILKQFDDGDNRDNHKSFKDIDHSKIKSVAYISNFNYQTDNVEKRIIVRLDWETGLFNFLNGFAPQDLRAKCCMKPLEGEKKLILFARKRFSSASGQSQSEFKELIKITDEFSFYNRFILGYQVPSGEKMTVIIEPNGDMKIFDN